jgi:hypothetical protein
MPIGSAGSPKVEETLERFARKGSEVVDHKSNSLKDHRKFERTISNM